MLLRASRSPARAGARCCIDGAERANARPFRFCGFPHPLKMTECPWMTLITPPNDYRLASAAEITILIGAPFLPESSSVLCSAHLARALSQKIAAMTASRPSPVALR